MSKTEPQFIGEPTKKMRKVDQSIAVINYLLGKKKNRINDLSRKVELSESQKIFIGEETDLIKNVETLVGQVTNQFNSALGKLPPQALELEISVLGCAIYENPEYDKIKKFLLPEHFYNPSHQEIWAAALAVGSPVDFKSVIEVLRKNGKLELVGGITYIVELTNSSTGNIEGSARILIEMAIKRQIILTAGKLLSDAYDDKTDCFDLLENAELELKKIREWIK